MSEIEEEALATSDTSELLPSQPELLPSQPENDVDTPAPEDEAQTSIPDDVEDDCEREGIGDNTASFSRLNGTTGHSSEEERSEEPSDSLPNEDTPLESNESNLASDQSLEAGEVKPVFTDPLPDCKTKRSYLCGFCNMKTQNPREYLYHLKDTHGEKNLRIYECSLCVYATKTTQKLIRHADMVHKIKLTLELEKKPKVKTAKVTASGNAPKSAASGVMSRSPRESKSPRRFEEYEYSDDIDLDIDDYYIPTKVTSSGKQVYRCNQCTFSAHSPKVLAKHEMKYHLKRKFYKCGKCNYATHLKARYTKHMKYHQLPIIKCEWCDFRTPYPWNLDRHNKNHTEDTGEHKCHLCNFTAQIKQSLTVHVANHHLTPEQIKAREARRTIGISDPDDCVGDDEMELLRLEREEDLDALEIPNQSQSFTVSNIDMGMQDDADSSIADMEDCRNGGQPKAKKPKIKITFKKMKSSVKETLFPEFQERHKFEDDFIHPDDVVHRNGNVYIKTEKCSLCSFKAPFEWEVQRHKRKVHGIHSFKEATGPRKIKKEKLQGLARMKDGVPPLERPTDTQPTSDTTKEERVEAKDEAVEDDATNSEEGKNDSSTDVTEKKKSLSFFDKLKEKLSLSNVENLVCQFCGHESKCLSESVRHQKLHLSAKNIFASASLSTRCQFCRHRCKTTDDLVNHLKSCPEARKNQINDDMSNENTSDTATDASGKSPRQRNAEGLSSLDGQQHPMENKVFVWNISKFDDEERENSLDEGSRSPSEACSDNTDQMSEPKSSKCTQVYRCPQCSFRSTTASRFHVHMVGHYNKKPYSCSLCSYRSNWRWDITKHIKLKIARDGSHKDAEICLSDETLIEKNYEKYDQYLTQASRDEIHHSEGGFSLSRKGPQKRNNDTDSTGTDSAKSSPCPTPFSLAGSKIPAPPKLTRAPNRPPSLGPNPFGAILPGGSQTTAENGNASGQEDDSTKKKVPLKPPPLVAMAALAKQQQLQSGATNEEAENDIQKMDTSNAETGSEPGNSNYQIITPQGAMNTSLETLQLLASGSTNLARLKRQQKETGEGKDPELDAAVANQMRLLIWLNCLVGGADKKEEAVTTQSTTTTDYEAKDAVASRMNIMKLVLDHEGNPEWKCSSCDFRDNEKETVVQHVRLAHGKRGPVNLIHAVHRCSVCGFAAGTKRHVQVHLESAHNGQGGIISKSEGQNVEPEFPSDDNVRSMECQLCPYISKKKSELKSHLNHHSPKTNYVFKCMFCPFYVATKYELFSHLAVHVADKSTSSKDSRPPTRTGTPAGNSQEGDDGGSRQFICDMCPFETRSRAKLMHHRQFHRPRGLPFNCPHCSYNVTRRHLLAQHLRIHGVSPTEGMFSEISGDKASSDAAQCRKSPSPSLTITPISGIGAKQSTYVPGTESNIDPSCLPTLSDVLTRNLHDIPLVWVSRDGRYFKMFKCRHCPHVNLRKSNIQEHEKMHRSENMNHTTGHACQFCSYMCINAGVMSAHVKVHSGSMGLCHAIVDQALPNEEQLKMLASTSTRNTIGKEGDEKHLYYCQQCPARFFFGKEVQIHSRFHMGNSSFIHHCSKCNFGSREESQILAHVKVHTPEYQERTRTLMTMHPPAPSFPPVSGLSVPNDVVKPVFGVPPQESDLIAVNKDSQVNGLSRPWLAISPPPASQISSTTVPQPPPTSRFKCDQCPSSFSKLITLQYHQSLHSADNPFRCSRCTYTAKTQDGLQQHTALHEQAELEKSSATALVDVPSEQASLEASSLSSPQKILQNTLGVLATEITNSSIGNGLDQPPIKLKFIGLKGSDSSAAKSAKKQQFKYYIEEQVPLSGIDLLKRKHQIEAEMPKDESLCKMPETVTSGKTRVLKPEEIGNPSLYYPLHIDKVSGRSRDKRYKCRKCPSAFEKLDQFNVHLNLHGAMYKYKCKICDYSVKFYANFMMHSKRHKYHEKMNAQNQEVSPPPDDHEMFQPIVRENIPVVSKTVSKTVKIEDSCQNKENRFDFNLCPDMTMAEKQQIVLQNKKADAFLPKDEDKDKKIFYCQYCPYANLRRDAVDSHGLRHLANGGKGLYRCNFCDYTASGPNFIREHTKVHFRPFKYVLPEGFMRHDKCEIWSIKSGDVCEDDMTPKKSLVFGHDEGSFTPKIGSSNNFNDGEDMDDPQNFNGILVDFRSGDVVEAPSNFVIPMRPSSKFSSSKNSRPAKQKKGARKHTKLKSSPDQAKTTETDLAIDYQTVDVEETSGFGGEPLDAGGTGGDPLDISNNDEDNLEDGDGPSFPNDVDQEYEMTDLEQTVT